MRRPGDYDIVSHGEMILDRSRVISYVAAMRRAVRQDSIVLDLGAGTGFFALLACKFGAKRVYAIEANEIIEQGKKFAVANHYDDRIVFIQDISTKISLPEQVDIIVSDLRGVFPLYEHHVPAIIDARDRLLSPGGNLIPQVDTLWASIIDDAQSYRPYHQPWLENAYDLDLQVGKQLAVNNWRRINSRAENLLVLPQRWAELDYRTIATPNVAGKLEWTVNREGTAHGLLIWFESELADGIGLSNAPGQPELVYGQGFFPLQEPVPLAAGDHIEIELSANLVGSDYVWRWNTQVDSDSGTKASFEQSTFYGLPLSTATLKRHEAGFTPSVTQETEIDRFCLSLVDGSRCLEEIATQVAERFPRRFRRGQDALTYVADLLENYQTQTG